MKLKKLTACLLAAALSFSAFTPAVSATAATVTTSAESIVPEEAASFTPETASFASHTMTLPAGEKSAVQEINMKHAGYLFIPVSIPGSEKGITVQLYSDADCTAKVGYSTYLSSGTVSAVLKAPISKAGTYYLQASTYSGMTSDVELTLNPYCFNSANRKISAKKTVYSYSGSNDIIYHKISVPENGYIFVEASSNNSVGSLNVQLFNSSKKESSDSMYVSNSVNKGEAAFAVKKGTYYIGTKSSDIVRLKYHFTAVKEKSGTSKKTAVNIKKGKTAKGLVLYTDKATKYDYYKVKLTKKQVLSLTLSTKGSNAISFEVIPASDKVILFGSKKTLHDINTDTMKTKDKLPAGTYYIKVGKNSKTSAGSYSIKFN